MPLCHRNAPKHFNKVFLCVAMDSSANSKRRLLNLLLATHFPLAGLSASHFRAGWLPITDARQLSRLDQQLVIQHWQDLNTMRAEPASVI